MTSDPLQQVAAAAADDLHLDVTAPAAAPLRFFGAVLAGTPAVAAAADTAIGLPLPPGVDEHTATAAFLAAAATGSTGPPFDVPWPEGSDPPAGHLQIRAAVEKIVSYLPVLRRGGTQQSTPQVEIGVTNSAVTTTAGRSVAVTFGQPFAAVPTILVTGGGSGPTAAVDPRGFYFANTPSTTGFTLRMVASTADQIMQAHWAAIGVRAA